MLQMKLYHFAKIKYIQYKNLCILNQQFLSTIFNINICYIFILSKIFIEFWLSLTYFILEIDLFENSYKNSLYNIFLNVIIIPNDTITTISFSHQIEFVSEGPKMAITSITILDFHYTTLCSPLFDVLSLLYTSQFILNVPFKFPMDQSI